MSYSSGYASVNRRDDRMSVREKKRLLYLILIILFLLMLIISTLVGSGIMGDFRQLIDREGNKEFGDLNENVVNLPDAKPLRCVISSAPTFKRKDSMGTFKIANHKDNDGLILQVTITDRETGETIYISPPLMPGEKVEKDYLMKYGGLYTKGEHEAVATFAFFEQGANRLYYEVPIGISINILG